MCRIAGIIDFNSIPSEQLLLQMTEAMKHGGPDDAGMYVDDTFPLVFGHRRLALIDLSPNGHQPMFSADKDIVIVFNGEIYNYQELKEELIKLGVVFKTTSDTEVIIYAYKIWGKDCFSKFNGMFALAIIDKVNNKLLLARDHAGIKPLYYTIQKDKVIFASEIRAFKAIDKKWPENSDWKKHFLLFGHLPEPVTTLKGVSPLPKATCLEFDLHTKQVSTTCFNSFYYNYSISTEEEAVQIIRDRLSKAVKRHLISDAPIGLFLSGGLDSSLLTILAKSYIGDNLQTLSIDFENAKYSERKYQQIIAEKTGAKHKAFIVTQKQFEDSIADILQAMDQPSSDGINSYFISKYAKEYGLKAVLSGIGADELFGGYSSFNRAALLKKITQLPAFMFAIANIAPGDKWKRISFLQRKDGLGEYLFNRGFFVPKQVAALLDCSEEEVNGIFKQTRYPLYSKELEVQERVSYNETNWYMQNQLLKDTDYMSMWHSIEVRVPFLDKELMSAVFSIQPAIKYAKQPKHLLIKAFKEELPEAIYNRPKQGFIFPFESWMKELTFPSGIKQSAKLNQMKRDLVKGNIHWSRYWCYLLAMEHDYFAV